MNNYYDTLGVNEDATNEEIKKAYRKKANEMHPDKGGSNEEFSRLSIAYKVLSDEDARKEYDSTGVTDDLPDEVKAAINYIRNKFISLVNDICNTMDIESIETSNLRIIVKVSKAISSDIEMTKAAIDRDNTLLSRLQKVSTKVTTKGKTDKKNLFKSVTFEMEETVQRHIAEMRNNMKMLDEANSLIKIYIDEKPENQQENSLHNLLNSSLRF
jgi:curved DNA-binding protein CbpA